MFIVKTRVTRNGCCSIFTKFFMFPVLCFQYTLPSGGHAVDKIKVLPHDGQNCCLVVGVFLACQQVIVSPASMNRSYCWPEKEDDTISDQEKDKLFFSYI